MVSSLQSRQWDSNLCFLDREGDYVLACSKQDSLKSHWSEITLNVPLTEQAWRRADPVGSHFPAVKGGDSICPGDFTRQLSNQSQIWEQSLYCEMIQTLFYVATGCPAMDDKTTQEIVSQQNEAQFYSSKERRRHHLETWGGEWVFKLLPPWSRQPGLCERSVQNCCLLQRPCAEVTWAPGGGHRVG